MSVLFHIEPECAGLFRQHGLADFTSWMGGDVGEMVSRGAGREVRRLKLGGETFFLKKRWGERAGRLLGMLLSGSRPLSGPLRELRLVHALRGEGFAVMEPLAWGESRSAGMPKEGFLVVRGIPGRPLEAVYDETSGKARLALMERVGELSGRLHAKGFFHHLRLKDLIETPDGVLTIIDRESGQPWARRFSTRIAMTALARTARRTLRDGHVIGPGAASAFFRGYRQGVAGRWRTDSKELGRLAVARIRKELGPPADRV